MPRPGRGQRIGALAAFRVGHGTRRITGTIILVDGGQHLMARVPLLPRPA